MKHQPPLILIADDQKPTVQMLERVFANEGYAVRAAYDGEMAIVLAKTLIPDLILLDINMPKMNGFDVLKTLRENQQTAAIPTILITAMSDLQNVVQGIKLGADDYLRKPFHPQELLARAQSKMRARELELQLQMRTHQLETLLRVAEALNQHAELEALLDFTMYLLDDLIRHDVAFLAFRLDIPTEHPRLLHRIQSRNRQEQFALPDDLINELITNTEPIQWGEDSEMIPGWAFGVIVPILFRQDVRGFLGVAHHSEHDQSIYQLLIGITRQVSLALQNAELNDIKAHYAQNLEQQVLERTAELESTQRMLVRSEKLASIGRLSAAIAHEINNPLLPIKLDLEGLLEDIGAGNQIDRKDVAHILANVDRIEHTVENLLGFTGNKQTDSAPFTLIDLNAIIEDIIQLNEKMLRHGQVTVLKSLTPLPQIYGNKYQLEYVFMNLTLNAFDAMSNGGELTFLSQQTETSVQVVVSDTGSGIAPDLMDSIFEPFVSTKDEGNGLGLYISYDIMQKHHASIQVESRLGEGTTFYLQFPIPTQ